uniref:Integrase catalytic domain-containing protein n=1 Tax=Loa loa TaxID=7209 RepID=A0A1I7VCX5_LOALO
MIWKNTVSRAPRDGGVYERLIGLTKEALRKAVGRRLLTEREMTTLITEIEGILNTRPLTYVGFDDYRIIRPIDFISPMASLDIPIKYENQEEEYTPYVLKTRDNLIKHWTSNLKTLDVFWKLWREDYLATLRERQQKEIHSPRLIKKRLPQVNEIVLLVEPNDPRDGRTRSVTIQLPNGKQLDRSLNMVCPLEINSVNNNDLSNTKDLQEDDLEEPIASRTRSAKKTAKHAETTSKTISNNFLKTLSLITILSLVTVQIAAANNCKGISGISYNFPQRWNCEEIINELQASFIIDKENNTNPYLMRGNIILDMANGNDENLTKKSPRAITKQLLMLETAPEETFDPNNIRINAELELVAHNQDIVNTIYHRPKDDSLWQEISEQREELTNQLGKEFGQILDSERKGHNKTNNILMHGLQAMEGKTLQITTNVKLTRITSNAIKIIRASRAVHLELVEDLSAENFSHIMRTIVARRGYPKLILSDNASQFQLVFKKIMDEKAYFLAEKGMIWKNTVSRAPRDGGVYERLIGLTKEALRKAVGRRLLTEREMTTLITEIEGILNTRPLTYVGFDDYRIIRPIDFISPMASLDIPIKYENQEEEYTPYVLKTRDNLIKHWTSNLKTLDVFWKLWREDYLATLRERQQKEIHSPRLIKKRLPQVNEIVLLVEPNDPRDGRTRSVTIQLPNGKQLDRSLNMVCPLEINSVNNNDLSNTKDLQEDDLEEPIASRTRSAKKTAKHAETTSKTISNNFLKTLSLITILSLVTVQIAAANNCKGISGISYNFPQRWNCEEIINELQASFIIDKENNTNPYLMRGNIILDMANGNDENLTKKSPRAITKQLLMLETAPEETFDPNNIRINAELELVAHNQDIVNTIYHRPKDDSLWQEISEQREELTNQLGKEFGQVIQSNQEELDNVATHWRLIT